jgi:hypothetical protein
MYVSGNEKCHWQYGGPPEPPMNQDARTKAKTLQDTIGIPMIKWDERSKQLLSYSQPAYGRPDHALEITRLAR